MSTSLTVFPLRILVLEAEEPVRKLMAHCLGGQGHSTLALATLGEALQAIARQGFDLVFFDVRLAGRGMGFLPALLLETPWAKAVALADAESIPMAIDAMRHGAVDYLPKPIEATQLQLLCSTISQRRKMESKLAALQHAVDDLDFENDPPSSNALMRSAINLAHQVAATRVPVLIYGEPGVGKRRLARAICNWSHRAEAPLAIVSCRAPVDALEAELFGVPPAFAGPNTPAGKVALCDHGNLVLDEIGHTPARLQAKLLSLVCDQQYERMDEMLPRSVDVRIIATSSIDLQLAAKAGTFRRDLVMALEVVPIKLPALRDRRDEIPSLCDRYLNHFGRQNHRAFGGFTADARYVLDQYSWPGNVRELRNVIERAALLCHSQQIGIEHLPTNLSREMPAHAIGDLVSLETIERLHISRVVASARSMRRAASILEIDSGTLCRRMKRYASKKGPTGE